MSFKPKQSLTYSDQREKDSVDFVNSLLKNTESLPRINTNDKEANIDGYIELLDEDKCIVGKLTVQVKTVSPSIEGLHKYPCPTGLFAYAERTMDFVVLIAVDQKEKAFLWKYISKELINDNSDKKGQSSITLYFNDLEIANAKNINEVVSQWKQMFFTYRQLRDNSEMMKKENEELRAIAKSAYKPLSLPTEDVKQIQKFIDTYNILLDTDFSYVKETLFPDMWEMGLIVFIYKSDELLYGVYPIKAGENIPLIIESDPEEVKKGNYYSAIYSYSNSLKIEPIAAARRALKSDIKKFIKKRNLLDYDDFLMEYIMDFLNEEHRHLRIPQEIHGDLSAMSKFCAEKYHHYTNAPITIITNGRNIHLSLFESCLNIMLARGYQKTFNVYPQKGHFGKSGNVSDWFSPELAFEKLKIVVTEVYKAYTQYLGLHFPKISNELDML